MLFYWMQNATVFLRPPSINPAFNAMWRVSSGDSEESTERRVRRRSSDRLAVVRARVGRRSLVPREPRPSGVRGSSSVPSQASWNWSSSAQGVLARRYLSRMDSHSRRKRVVKCVSTVTTQTTAFAKLTILPQPRALSSALTTPPMRFPIISFLLLIRTAALSSKRM